MHAYAPVKRFKNVISQQKNNKYWINNHIMGVCQTLCKEKSHQTLDNPAERVSSRTLDSNLDTDKASLTSYLEYNQKNMLPRIIEIYEKVLSNSLTDLTIINERIPQKQIKFLIVALRYSYNLEVLILRSNDLGRTGAEKISSILKYTPQLTDLIIENNNIKSEGIKCICDNLHNLPYLVVLSLSNNQLSYATENLGKALGHLSNLTELYLDFMEISAHDFNVLSPYISKCSKLVKLGLGFNRLNSSNLTAICSVLNSLPEIKECVLSDIEIHESEIDKLIIRYSNINIKI